jgi:ubiquinone/menaquinone biosynthesis C-methylase UbiE
MKDTSWGKVADWYDEVVSDEDSYQKKVILPNILRIVSPKKGLKVLDLACGQGFFSHEMVKAGAEVVGVDISKELIAKAAGKKISGERVVGAKHASESESFFSAAATDLSVLGEKKFDVVFSILAIQNIENISKTFKEVSRVLTLAGKLVIVLNHPTFRIPKKSSWGFDDAYKVQYRRIDEYLSESRADIDMNPAEKEKSKTTISFHRPLQVYSKTLANAGFAISRIEEWISHKESQKGPRQIAEDRSRREIPLFMCLECVKIGK